MKMFSECLPPLFLLTVSGITFQTQRSRIRYDFRAGERSQYQRTWLEAPRNSAASITSFFFGLAQSMQTFLAQGLNPHHSCNPSHSNDNTGSSICLATGEFFRFFLLQHSSCQTACHCEIMLNIIRHGCLGCFTDHSRQKLLLDPQIPWKEVKQTRLEIYLAALGALNDGMVSQEVRSLLILLPGVGELAGPRGGNGGLNNNMRLNFQISENIGIFITRSYHKGRDCLRFHSWQGKNLAHCVNSKETVGDKIKSCFNFIC